MTPIELARRLATLVGLLATTGCATASLQGGPMAGFSGTTGAAVWLMTDSRARVALQYWPARQPDHQTLSPEVVTQAETGYTARLALDALTPDTDYRYRVLIDGRPIDGDPPFALRTQPTQPRAPREFTIAAGSCSHVDARAAAGGASAFSSQYAIFDAMAARQPDIMLWLGDHIYYRDEDFGDGHRERMHQRWRDTRAFPALQKLLRTGHHYGIWDDHDYGPNDSNRSFALKSDALDTFRRYFANPAYGLPDLPGVFFKTSFEDVDLFMLDDRYYRDDDDAEDAAKTMLGQRQIEWLKRELETSKATFKLIANGSRMLSDRPTPEKRGGEGWHNFPGERAAFLDWLQAKRIEGVFLLSGDVHYTHLTQRTRPGTYPLTELTCSPLTSRIHPRPQPVGEVPGTLVTEHNFCTLEFTGPPEARRMTVAVWNTLGARLWERRFDAVDLKHAD